MRRPPKTPDPAPQDVDDLIFGQDGPRVSER